MKHFTLSALLPIVLAVIGVPGCAPPFPRELLEKVDKNLSFAELRRDPERYAGKLLLLGGTIVDTKNTKEGTRIEVLQKALDSEGRPDLTDETLGRFLVLTERFLDPAVFQRGRPLTVVGEAAGSTVLPLGEIEYRYPVFRAKDLHLWSPYSGPRFSVGVGVYRGF